MAKKKTAIDNIPKAKLELKDELYAMDTKNKNFYNNLTDEQKKLFSAYVMMRWMSLAPDQEGLHDYHITAVNEFVNDGFWLLSKDPEFQYLLLSVCGTGSKQYHQWIPHAKSKTSNKSALNTFLMETFPGMNNLETQILLQTTSKEDFKDFLKMHGKADDEIKELVKQFEKIKPNASNE
jgi:uncharacterized protein YdcH (DUF465 family)